MNYRLKSLEYIEKKKDLLLLHKERGTELDKIGHSALLNKYERYKSICKQSEDAARRKGAYNDLSSKADVAEKQFQEAKNRLKELKINFENRIAALEM